MKLVTSRNIETGKQHFHYLLESKTNKEQGELRKQVVCDDDEFIKTVIQYCADNIIDCFGTKNDFTEENIETHFTGIELGIIKRMMSFNKHKGQFKNPLLCLHKACTFYYSQSGGWVSGDANDRLHYIDMHSGEPLFWKKFDEIYEVEMEQATNVIFGIPLTLENFRESAYYSKNKWGGDMLQATF